MFSSFFVFRGFVEKKDWANQSVGLFSVGLEWTKSLCDVKAVFDLMAMSWAVSLGFENI